MAHNNDMDSSTHQPSVFDTPGHGSASAAAGSVPDSQRHNLEPEYQNFVFTDPVTFRALEEDPATTVVDRRCNLTGFEIYVVEQWACSRGHPTFVINTFTGDPSHTVVAGVLSIPTDERAWSPGLKLYFEAMSQYHTRRRDTPVGILLVTNLSSFPSSLTVIPVPEGDVRIHRDDFIVNENLKRLGCSGRAGLNLKYPSPATEAKFHQLYQTSERVPFYSAVMELVKLCQIALNVFSKLTLECADGLLCDVTERAINDWWADIGTELYNIEPSDGILGPTTVSALLGTYIGARNRLHAYGVQISKDAFELESFKRAVGSFQKAQKLERTRRLDRQTLDKLHRVTAKAASGEGWVVPRAVKSTVAELGGKGGEMVMGIVGGRDKAGISEIETLDMDRFVQLVVGARSKWLWHGKPKKIYSDLSRQDTLDEEPTPGKDTWSNKRRDVQAGYSSGRPSFESEPSWRHLESPGGVDGADRQLKSGLKKSVTGKVSDARAGLGRFRDAVGLPGLRSHPKPSKENIDFEVDLQEQSKPDRPTSSGGEGVAGDGNATFPENSRDASKDTRDEKLGHPLSAPPVLDDSMFAIGASQNQSVVSEQPPEPSEPVQIQPQAYGTPVAAASVKPGAIEPSQTLGQVDPPAIVTRVLRRPRSCNLSPSLTMTADTSTRYPRHLSFSAVETSILPWEDVGNLEPSSKKASMTLEDAILREDIRADDVRTITSRIADLDRNTVAWVDEQVSAVEQIERNSRGHLAVLELVYQEKLDEHGALRESSTELIAKESGEIIERSKRVELLGAKLDYELGVLDSRIGEVEDGLVDHERHIVELEERVRSLVKHEKQKSASSWFGWGYQLFGRGGRRP